MSKIKAEIWGREFELPIIVKKFSGEDSTETQKEAVERFKNNLQLIDAAKPEVEKYILENGLKDNGITEVDNIFKYVIPKTIAETMVPVMDPSPPNTTIINTLMELIKV